MGISDRFARRTDSAPRTGARGIGNARLLAGGIALTTAGALALIGLAGAGSASAATSAGRAAGAAAAKAGGYQFVTIGSHRDRTFNQILGINNNGRIAAYFGSGAQGHPNKGYTITAPYAQGDIKSENFPHSVQTQVTGLNDGGVQVGFYSTQNTASGTNNNFGWYFNGSFHQVVFPTGNNAKPVTDQLLGVNDHDVAVGFYNNGSGASRGYEYNIKTHRFSLVSKPGAPTGGKAPSLTAAAINNRGDVAGFYATSGGATDAFLKLAGGRFTTIAVPHASATMAFGVNDNDTVVGTYTDGSGSTATTHGFIWQIGGHMTTGVDDPNGVGTTLLNGINDENDIVGFYTDSAGNTDGLLAFPAF
ncbi:MAG TPA: hypothetical protein VHZ33_12165 [Trebonia sp.]|jgi:hypothetical protein|nr:hypothetical protein [Trebonia sp.]